MAPRKIESSVGNKRRKLEDSASEPEAIDEESFGKL